MLIGATTAATAGVFASNYDDWIDIAYRNIKIVVNGKEIHPNAEPFVSEGTTYLPVRDVADAFGQSVYWDGPNYTVYLGKMDGILDYPSLKLVDTKNIGGGWGKTSDLTDNYGKRH